ncbi:uncharacterized protein EDB93DRAFT_1083700 [Suillus bovinus]|uniref:uncharacterized protein n=1 Tax=Suillus bovinus TaxID=48563 RepID=UPI001B87A67C|nr:uncharacterized protein EDB93DRAFT_1083700 [Suillus bovinus]KAG2151062.1 hypothetical protein EDB93DRAFT_1083700 [Suillus bovinus]
MLPAITNDVPSTNRPRFSLASIAALDSNTFAQEFTETEHQAAVRALLRHDAHLDGTHFHTRKPAGLHPSYIAFNSYTTLDEKFMMHKEFVEAALQDLFDAVAMQDRLDGRISLVIRCPGSEATPTLSPEHLSLDLYITPRELCESPDRIGGDISVMVQAFEEEFAVPHLRHFTERCHIEGVVPPHHCKSAPSFSLMTI